MQIERVKYQINWKNFKKGYSFLIPCLDAKASRKLIAEETKRLKYTVVTKVVIEDGVRGVRVWRL
jgi:hypothetical protein|tara:strand:+ start:5664 stop:5858 length:195 start_codon:yes stop_codon:yes gene_type:complete